MSILKAFAVLAVIALTPVSSLAGQVSTPSSAKYCAKNKPKAEVVKTVTASVHTEKAAKAQ